MHLLAFCICRHHCQQPLEMWGSCIMAVFRDIGFNNQIGFHYRTLYSIEIVFDV
ncbi:hypothetical protein ACS0TY_025792 [Phlomoides rotata]